MKEDRNSKAKIYHYDDKAEKLLIATLKLLEPMLHLKGC